MGGVEELRLDFEVGIKFPRLGFVATRSLFCVRLNCWR